MIGLFSIFNAGQENVLAFSLFWFVIFWLIPSLIGAGVTIHETRKNPTLFNKKPNS